MCPKMKWQIGVIIAIINMSLMHTMLRSFSGGVCVIESVILTTPASRKYGYFTDGETGAQRK